MALALLLLLPLSACVIRDNRITLKFMTWADADQMRILQKAMEGFEKAHPEAKVLVVRAPYNEYVTKVLTQFAGKLSPDVLSVNAEQLPAFATRGVLLDLVRFTEKDPSFRAKDFHPEVLARYTVNGRLLAIPTDIAPVCVVYYNKKAFDEAGLPYPKDSWDRAAFLAAARKLTKRDASGKVLRWGFLDDWAIWESWVFANGGRIVDDVTRPTKCLIGDPKAVEGVQFRADLMHRYRVMPSPSGLTAMGGLGNADLFINGSLALFYSGIWKTPRFRGIKDFDWDIVTFPAGPGGKRGYPMSGTGYSVVKGNPHPELAYELVKFLAGKEGQRLMAATGLIQPALRTLGDSPEFLDGQPPANKRMLNGAVRYGVFRAFDPRADEWMNMIGSRLDRVWSGDRKAAEVLPQAALEVNERFFKVSKPPVDWMGGKR